VGRIVFESPEELRWLESVLHPLVGERLARWRAELPSGTTLAVVEVPLLFETGMEGAFDATVAVVAHDAARAERAGERGTELLAAREAEQLSQEEKAARATHVVSNDGTREDLEAALAELLPRLTGARVGT
jgi:dephospho-CoA kinase